MKKYKRVDYLRTRGVNGGGLLLHAVAVLVASPRLRDGFPPDYLVCARQEPKPLLHGILLAHLEPKPLIQPHRGLIPLLHVQHQLR
eukprot:CAMPEP_0174901824 /NCGR_PEP_ID=MMETSP0167-20121228/35873_1 /TAXON_ID=38298 /ORGANISM="Rhodella maculata, Strain CCMP736" /LENGTH=85 /DNA_ID=CAMNT_0016143627 /DNA_START=96 /DNA_END=350 /DNA_ORIENTATION=-